MGKNNAGKKSQITMGLDSYAKEFILYLLCWENLPKVSSGDIIDVGLRMLKGQCVREH
jgi:hypothetical protein